MPVQDLPSPDPASDEPSPTPAAALDSAKAAASESFSSRLARLCHVAPESLRALPGPEVPVPYHQLLVHERDMTSTLEGFHRETLRLEVLHLERRGELLLRRVLLVGENSGLPRELGAIHIHLEHFESAPRAEILEARIPLGTILSRHRVPYQSRPSAFHVLSASQELVTLLPSTEEGRLLYGRSNRLLDPGSGLPLAEVLEILPPSKPQS
ncbi:MAG: hypothetical protein AAGD01_11200 [Acidobacteriota bacterium]